MPPLLRTVRSLGAALNEKDVLSSPASSDYQLIFQRSNPTSIPSMTVTSPYVLASFPADPSITPTPTMIDEYLTILNSNPFPVDALELLSPAVTVKLASTAGAIYSSLGTFPTSGNPPIAVTVALNKSCNTATWLDGLPPLRHNHAHLGDYQCRHCLLHCWHGWGC